MLILMALTLAAAASPATVETRVKELNALLSESW
jgi:hypothetical protein